MSYLPSYWEISSPNLTMCSSTTKDSKLTRKEIKRGLRIFQRHAIDKPQLPQSLPRLQVDDYYDIGSTPTQEEINEWMKEEKHWVMQHGNEQMKMNFPTIVDREAKSQKGKDEKFKKRHVSTVCQKAKRKLALRSRDITSELPN